MLVLTRRKDQDILIGDDIRIVVLESFHGRTRIGIEAPPDTRILRGELTETDPPKPTPKPADKRGRPAA